MAVNINAKKLIRNLLSDFGQNPQKNRTSKSAQFTYLTVLVAKKRNQTRKRGKWRRKRRR